MEIRNVVLAAAAQRIDTALWEKLNLVVNVLCEMLDIDLGNDMVCGASVLFGKGSMYLGIVVAILLKYEMNGTPLPPDMDN